MAQDVAVVVAREQAHQTRRVIRAVRMRGRCHRVVRMGGWRPVRWVGLLGFLGFLGGVPSTRVQHPVHPRQALGAQQGDQCQGPEPAA